MEEDKVIHETRNYELMIGMSSGVKSMPCYQIINKKYKVVEQEFFILAQALVNLEQMEKLLVDFWAKGQKEANVVSLPSKGN